MDKPLLKGLADNQSLFDEVKSMLLNEFMIEDSRSDDQVSDERLGQMFRARLVGIQKIEKVFKEIAKYKSRIESQKPIINRAR